MFFIWNVLVICLKYIYWFPISEPNTTMAYIIAYTKIFQKSPWQYLIKQFAKWFYPLSCLLNDWNIFQSKTLKFKLKLFVNAVKGLELNHQKILYENTNRTSEKQSCLTASARQWYSYEKIIQLREPSSPPFNFSYRAFIYHTMADVAAIGLTCVLIGRHWTERPGGSQLTLYWLASSAGSSRWFAGN